MVERLRYGAYAAIVATIFALSAGVQAQEPTILALESGQAAPYAGMLLPDEVVIRWRQEIERLRFEVGLYEQRIAAMQTAHVDAVRVRDEAASARLALHDELWTQRATDLREVVEQARRERDEARRREGPRWYQRPALWFVLGAGAASALAITVSR